MTSLPIASLPARSSKRFTPLSLRAGWRHSLAALLVSCLMTPPALAQLDYSDPQPPLTRLWLPEKPGRDTLSLFPFDQHEDVASEQALESIDEVLSFGDDSANAGGPSLDGLGGGAGGSKANQPKGPDAVVDTTLWPQHAKRLGQAKWTTTGRFAGGLAVTQPGDGVITSVYNKINSRTGGSYDVWVKPDDQLANADRPRLLFELTGSRVGSSAAGPAFRLLVLPDGRLQVQANGQPIGTTDVDMTLKPGQWRHVTLIVTPSRMVQTQYAFTRKEVGPQAIVKVNGVTALVAEDDRVAKALEALTGQLVLARGSEGIAPLTGEYDHLRITPGIAPYYPFRLTRYQQPADGQTLPTGWPVLRDAEDQSLHLDFEQKLADFDERTQVLTADQPGLIHQARWDVLRAEYDKQMQTGRDVKPLPSVTPKQSKEKLKAQGGLRGQGLLVGAGNPAAAVDVTDSLNAREGTLEFWFTPDDFDNRQNEGFHKPLHQVPLLNIVGFSDDAEQPQTHGLLSFNAICMDPLRYNPPPLQPGTWYQAIITWRGNKATAYINGKPAPLGLIKLSFKGLPQPKPAPSIKPEAAVDATGDDASDAESADSEGDEQADVTAEAEDATDPTAADAQVTQDDGFRDWHLVLGPTKAGGVYRGEDAVLDEVRLYRRSLTPLEVANSYRRFAPDEPIEPLPFAWHEVGMNQPLTTFSLQVELLAPERDKVASIAAQLFRPDTLASGSSEPDAAFTITPNAAGRAWYRDENVPVAYGEHRVSLQFKDTSGQVLHTEDIMHNHPKPEWLGTDMGMNPGKALPGWDPLRIDDTGRITLELRDIQIGPDGLPHTLVSRGADMLASPIAITAKADGQSLALKPDSAAPTIEHQADDLAITEGAQSADGLTVSTRAETQFDGLMKLTLTVSADKARTLEHLTVRIPIKPEHAEMLGYWGGDRNFRGACWYGPMPEDSDGDGVILDSTHKRFRHHAAQKGNFIPFVALVDDDRGLNWFAENDQHWTKSDKPAVVIEGDKKSTTLLLNIIQGDTQLKPGEPMQITFGLHLLPVREMPEDRRTKPRTGNFGFVDGFSKQGLKSDDGNHMSMTYWPEDMDWDAAAVRSEIHVGHYENDAGYQGPLLYTDRNWAQLPPNAYEYRPLVYGGGFYRYYDQVKDAQLFYFNEWIKRDLIHGVYIDDIFIVPSRNVNTGLAYIRPSDGKPQPGFEFFDYHDFLKRLRWLFHENGKEPFIWIHATNTLYMPCLSFADILLDGEWRFPNWGEERDFVDKWGLPRLRYNSPEKWGVPMMWMVKLGNDKPQPAGMDVWMFRQMRAYHAAMLLNDLVYVNHPARELFDTLAFSSDTARFLGYWDQASPVTQSDPQTYVSTYATDDKAQLVIWNHAREDRVVEIEIDPSKLGWDKPFGQLRVRDIDTWEAPDEVDYTRLKTPDGPAVQQAGDAKGDGAVMDMFDEVMAEASIDKEADPDADLTLENFRQKAGSLRLRVRARDYRLIEIQP